MQGVRERVREGREEGAAVPINKRRICGSELARAVYSGAAAGEHTGGSWLAERDREGAGDGDGGTATTRAGGEVASIGGEVFYAGSRARAELISSGVARRRDVGGVASRRAVGLPPPVLGEAMHVELPRESRAECLATRCAVSWSFSIRMAVSLTVERSMWGERRGAPSAAGNVRAVRQPRISNLVKLCCEQVGGRCLGALLHLSYAQRRTSMSNT